MKARIYFLDNLRIFLIFLVVVLHSGLVYEEILEYIWIVNDPEKCPSLGLVRMYLDIFVMFTLFFISGYFIPNSLKSKDSWGFLLSKFKRIMIPWIVAAFTLIPLYKIIFLYSRGLPQQEWFTYFHLFMRDGGHVGYYADNPSMGWLWFLPVLFGFQVIYLILAKTKLLSFKISLRTGVILTFVIGLVYSLAISNLNLRGWFHSPVFHFQNERLLTYFMVFLLGSLCNKLHIFDSDNKNTRLYILSNVILTISLIIYTAVALNLFFNMIEPGREYFFVSAAIDGLTYYITFLLSMLSFIYILVYVFRFHLNRNNKILSGLGKNSYGVYIIHMVVIGVFAYLLLNVSMPAVVKFIIVTVVTFFFSNLLVSVYRKVFKKYFSGSWPIIVIPVAAIILSIVIYTQKEALPQVPELPANTQVAPEVSIHAAAIQGDVEIIRLHILAGSDLNAKEPTGGSTPMISAALFGKTEVVKTLLEAGADVNIQNNDGSTALHTAAFFCQPEIVEILLDAGADKNIRNSAGSTALESVLVPFEAVRGIYEYFANTLGPLGLEIDYDYLERARPEVAGMLNDNSAE